MSRTGDWTDTAPLWPKRFGLFGWANVGYVIRAIGFAPHPPLIKPEVASGAAAELDELRTACNTLVTTLLDLGDQLFIVGDRQAVDIGKWLCRDFAFQAVTEIAANDVQKALAELNETSEEIAVLVMADGSARRSLKAPGYLDERSHAYDDTVAAALESGDAARLAALDPQLGTELLASGAALWPEVGSTLGDAGWNARLLFRDDPYGVSYFVGLWVAAEPKPVLSVSM